MSDRPPGFLAQMTSWADPTLPQPGAWCRACHGTRWWTERHEPKGWCCMTCHPPDHRPVEAIRREGETDDAPVPAAPPDPNADPLSRQVGIGLDDVG
jgi:hypothetical protein